MSDFITYNNIRLNQYIKLSEKTERKNKYFTKVARAINHSPSVSEKNKKRNHSITLETLTVNSSLILSTHHSILSPAFTFNIRAIVAGTLLLTAFVLLAPLIILVFCLKITVISSMFVTLYNYICTAKYLKLDLKSIMKRIIFKYYQVQLLNRDKISGVAAPVILSIQIK